MDSNMKSVLRNYISKCGEGRGLDKFLRRNSYSSDERDTSSITTSKAKITKSLESLELCGKTKSHNKCPEKQKISPNRKEKGPDKEFEASPKPQMEQAKVVVKQSGEKTDKKKSFNYESVIEISLPPPQQQIFSMPEPIKEKSSVDEKLEEPIKPIITTPKSKKIPAQNKISPSSGNDESSVSNKQNPMEWDSFFPGYDQEIETPQKNNKNMQLCNAMELDDNELNALKTYFHQRGLELPSENLIVVIKNRDEKGEQAKRLENIRKNKEKWQNIYEKYKEKYQQSSINFEEAEAQSTPKIIEASASKVSEQIKIIMNEKGSQTSLVKNSVKSVQVETNSLSKNAHLKTIESKTEDPYETFPNQSEIAESFEFVPGKKNSTKSTSSMSQKSSSCITEAGSSKNSGLSMSAKNEDISNFDDSLKVAIALLNSLLESNMRPELKRNLAEKVIHKITQLQTSKSIQTSTVESSGVYPLSNSSRVPSEVKSVKENVGPQESRRREEVLKECFQPMTKSEKSHQSSIDNNNDTASSKDLSLSKSIPKSQIMDFVKREKQTQLKWIEKEIEHLNNLRDLLKRNETPNTTNENCPVYENLSKLKEKFALPCPESEKNASEKEKMKAPDVNVWNSHGNMKKIKNRSKLETPRNESLTSYIDSRNKKFIEKYAKHQKQLYEEVDAYTKQFGSQTRHAQEERNTETVVKAKSKRTQMTANKDVQTSTSLASSSVFESSDSISVPINSNSNSKSTHYQAETFVRKEKNRENKQRVAVTQTTDSICRMRPIYGAEKYGTTSTTVTQRVHKMQNDKQLQAHPPSIKYTLTFDKKNSRPKVRPYSSLPQQAPESSKNSKEIFNQISSSVSLTYQYEENKENYNENDILFNNDGDEEDVDLQKFFSQKRPDIYSRFEQRKRCIEELKKLRQLRNEHRKKLLLLTSEKSLEGKLFNSLPEMPLKTTRIFSTKALKQQTKKVVKNLNEVQAKKQAEIVKNLKKKNRLMTGIFNKNLQRNVLKGNLNLSNTVTLTTK